MIIYLGADHRGFALKEELKAFLFDRGYDVVDMGNEVEEEGDDYPDFAAAVADAVSNNPVEDRGIVICGSGVGVDIVANKFIDIRSALISNSDQAKAARNDDDANVLALAADFLDADTAKAIVDAFIETAYDGAEHHQRRIDKITELELGPIVGESAEEAEDAPENEEKENTT
ncbi:MAG: Ribose-5-phosphate isomerase [Candidatus Wolfebacteria bacterium GW2011_GWE1_48_7]|uniref:Ribose-5-phosphate isomerase, ribose 5-phosphate isomerase B n=1 Tax=Candidatus Wolfebacteria bacterium GW2011_GWB1_47_1 TaxID=1619007 RepID=A0A0G4ARF7_9BACT|nr:MAG: ribose-5-phosphate isomerase, ribose 5-phosphate isomerase B [Candidatus Wolfebacteria bacterium GW2011_GWB1_47_1]KKU35551.1 MAG: Ribose-5-phosphate isomerase [Candidatus Wolfebacteria bacterium GW2011_GWC2_46_275]KKU41949.1 MAG: Ribose-5-phosphate isomerase [Candidatus Wolfebacteria bacterium GW2011_GWB2_46_69]KKU54515.1 MAG: Ribose-5-phosphate isomerase [Candidatus Wolfebacteria bacterium GW2011_GWC1_47_103]KKU59842.1 MAG: Ribose-5-phosphate isomerase [Candidatus Wolfebacteria bacteri